MRALTTLLAAAVLAAPLATAVSVAPPAEAATCPTPPGTVDRPVLNASYVPGLRAPLISWTTTCPNLTDFRLTWSYLRSDGTYTGPLAWEGRGSSLQLPEPEDPNAVAVSVGVQNRDLGGGAGWNGAQIPLQTIPPTAPGTPTLVDNGEGRVTVSWTAPQSDGGAAPTYTVTATPATTPGSTTSPTTTGCTTTQTTCLLTGLTLDSTYELAVTAANAAGAGPTSATNRITPAGPRLLAPTRVTARAKGSTMTVTWRPPGGQTTTTPIRYTVSSRPAGLACRTTATSCTFRRLAPGTAASFTVTAARGAKRTASRPSPIATIPVPPPTPSPTSTPTAPEPTAKPPQDLS
jgi:Fibronectin type III domain